MFNKQQLCHKADIGDHSAKGFTVILEGKETAIFLVRINDEVYGYINSCPHTGVNLDWMPDEFMDNTGTLIQCATHGALFNIRDGFCCSGPCAGDSLRSVKLNIEDGVILLDPAQ